MIRSLDSFARECKRTSAFLCVVFGGDLSGGRILRSCLHPWTMGLFGKKKAPPPSHKAPGALKNSFAEPTSPPSRTSTPSPKSVAQAPSKKAGASKPQRRSTMETRSFADKLESRNRAEALHRSARAQQHP